MLAFPALRAAELRIPLPVPDRSNSPMLSFQRDSVLFLLSSFAPDLTEGVSEEQSEVVIPSDRVMLDLMVATQNSWEIEGRFNYPRFAARLGSLYLRHRTAQHSDYSLPEGLAEFLSDTDFLSWPREVVRRSRVKGLTRVIYRSPPQDPRQMRIAQTLETIEGDLSAPVRETEIIFRRQRDDRNWDFYSYDSSGRLATQSTFRNGPLPSPAVCLACHYSQIDRAFVPVRD